jgi:uncharacterized protein (DUF1800 family)
MAQLTERQRIAHLLRRAGFGGSPEEIETYLRLGFDAAVDRLVDYEQVSNGAVEARVAEAEAAFDQRVQLPAVQLLWLSRMLSTARPLEEKMVLFWHNHFATANYKVGAPPLMHQQNKLFRLHALGNFRQLLYGVSRDPAMLRWLDSNSNRRNSPNENYARELMELFTMGVDQYSQDDVKEAARAFTGWFFDRNQGFLFNRNQHDAGDKTFLGRTGSWDGDDVVNLILEQPVTAEFIATKLFTFFVHDHPTPSTIAGLASAFRGGDYNVRELVRAILRSPEFSSEEAYHGVIKSPIELVVGALKQVGVAEFNRSLSGSLTRMGMFLYNPPDVSGWDWGTAWIGSATLLERLNFANVITTQRGENARFGLDPAAFVQRLGASTPEQIVDRALDLLVEGDVPSETRSALVAYLNNGYTGRPEEFTRDTNRVDRAIRGLVHLIMSTPVYQMA